MDKVSGSGQTGGPGQVDPGFKLPPFQLNTIKGLIGKFNAEKNTNQQTKVVKQIWSNLRPMIVAKYMVQPPPVAARYIALPPEQLPNGFDPAAYGGVSGAEIARLADTRVSADPTGPDARPFPDDMVMYYLVVPPPDNPEQAARYNKLRQFDMDMNKTFSALLNLTKTIVEDENVSDGELAEFTALHYSFDLCAKLFYDGVREYQTDFPFAPSPEEMPKSRAISDAARGAAPATADGLAPTVEPSAARGQVKKGN